MTEVRVNVECTAPTHKRGKRAKIHSFVRAAGGHWADAIGERGGWGRLPIGPFGKRTDAPPSRTVLDGDEPVSQEDHRVPVQALALADSPSEHGRRQRYQLRCKLCGDELVVRSERLVLVLDKFVEAGKSYVELDMLRQAVEWPS